MAARRVHHPLARLTPSSHRQSPRATLQARIWQRAPLVTPATRLAPLAQLGSSRPFVGGTVLVLVGGGIAYATLTGRAPLPGTLRSRLPVGQREQGLVVERGVTIQRPRDELYRFWRDFENLPQVLPHLRSVTAGPNGRSHWVTSGPAGRSVAWDAEIVEERANELIRWQSRPGAQVANRGEARFVPAPGGRGTEVRVCLAYEPPAGAVGATLAQLFGQGADRQVREALRHFKSLMEAGEIPTNDGQPMGTCGVGPRQDGQR